VIRGDEQAWTATAFAFRNCRAEASGIDFGCSTLAIFNRAGVDL
jgi:hypothetical protein